MKKIKRAIKRMIVYWRRKTGTKVERKLPPKVKVVLMFFNEARQQWEGEFVDENRVLCWGYVCGVSQEAKVRDMFVARVHGFDFEIGMWHLTAIEKASYD